jgi:hypothetical protein
MRTFKSIAVRILAALITFLIGWSCAKLTLIIVPRESYGHNGEAENIVDDSANMGRGEVASRAEGEPSRMSSWDGYVERGKVAVRAAHGRSKVFPFLTQKRFMNLQKWQDIF